MNHLLLIMVDGLGWPPGDLRASFYADCPHLIRLFEKHSVPISASLGVEGIPQSATGQTAILTGVNAAKLLGHHLHGFPNAELRAVIEQHNLFGKLQRLGLTCTFANAYALKPERTMGPAPRSVTTVATLAAFSAPRSKEDMLAGAAVYHDLTRKWLNQKSAVTVREIDETEAAGHLLDIMRSVDFCLFEYFLTDLAGHRGTRGEQQEVLASLDRFLGTLMDNLDPARELLLLTSDHGNIEAPERKLHTENPVPFSAFGCREDNARRDMKDLTGVTPKILSLFDRP